MGCSHCLKVMIQGGIQRAQSLHLSHSWALQSQCWPNYCSLYKVYLSLHPKVHGHSASCYVSSTHLPNTLFSNASGVWLTHIIGMFYKSWTCCVALLVLKKRRNSNPQITKKIWVLWQKSHHSKTMKTASQNNSGFTDLQSVYKKSEILFPNQWTEDIHT